MFLANKIGWAGIALTLLTTGMLGLGLMPRASAVDRGDIKKLQETLHDKGLLHGAGRWHPGPANPRRDSPVSEV